MKFGQQLEEEAGSAPAEFAGNFIAYKRLKKYLKYRQLNSAIPRETTSAEAEEAEKDFLRLLYQELKRVDRRFEKEAHRVLSAYELQTARCKCLAAMYALLTCRPGATSSKAAEKLALQARWCRRYAELNYLALRKIAKKRDRLLGGRVGEEFIQACLRGEVKARAFMSAPLLAELAAIEQMMLDKAGKTTAGHEPPIPDPTSSPVQAGEEHGSAADPSHASSSVLEFSDIDQDNMCAICLDLLYQPVSLSCGHILCARCALAAAVGHQNMYGPAEQLLMSAAGTSEKPCPCCRTALYGGRKEKESVFWDVKRLHRLEHLIKQKYPEDYQRRKEEDAADQAALKAARPTAWGSLRHLMSDASH